MNIEPKSYAEPKAASFWRSLLLTLGESLAAGLVVFFLFQAGRIAAAIVTTILVFFFRVQERARYQVEAGKLQLLHQLAESLPGMVYQCRLYPTGRCIVTYANSAIDWIYEKRLADMQKDCREIFDLVHPDDREEVMRTLVESALHLKPWKGEYRVVLPRQGVRWRFAQARVERLADGSTLWHGFIADVTWRKEAEDMLRIAREREANALRDAARAAVAADELKGEFLAMMSHEIRTPMNGIIGFTELLKNSPLPEEQQQYLEMIEQSGERLLTMVNNTLDLAKIESGSLDLNKTSVAVTESIRNVFASLRPLAEKKGLAYELEFNGFIPPLIVTDPARLSQVLTNLLGNAIKFTEQGSVVLRVSAANDPSAPGTWQWRFAVHDTGPGIPSEVLPKLFRPFYQADSSATRRYEGTGLGLAISRRLAKLLGGEITAGSEFGHGSVFTLLLPTAEAGED